MAETETEQIEQNNVCAGTVPMGEWLKQETQECRPCLMGPVVDWYATELEEKGRPELADELRQVVEELQDESEVAKVGERMDSIKEAVGEGELRDRLREFDCTVQTYRAPEGESEEGLDNPPTL
jgi:hypothetical protein